MNSQKKNIQKSSTSPSKSANNALKGGAFLLEKTDPQNVFIPEEWNEEQRMLLETVQEFFLQEVHSMGIDKLAQLDASKDMPIILDIFHKAADMGFCGVAIDEKYGGMDLDFNTNLLISEALSLGFSFATTIGAQTSIGSLPIVYYGTAQQKDKYLPGIASGEIKAAYCLTEPSAGSDANSGKSKVTFTKDGDFILNGQKMWITNGGFADLFIVFAKIENDKNLSAFIVEKAFGGITLGAEEKKLGIKASSTVQVFFENCPIPKENLLGKREGGFKIALNILNTGRIKLCAGGVGGSKFGITRSIEYATQRIQFEQPIANFGAIKHKIGEMVMQTHVTESAMYRTGYNIDQKYKEFVKQGQDNSEAKLNAIREFAVECALLKVKGSEVATYVVDEALQIHGGMGYSVETGIEMGYRDARITRIYEGTNEINRMLSVAELTKRAVKTKEIDLMGAGKTIPFYLIQQALTFRVGSKGMGDARIVENFKKAFLLISGAAGNKLKEKMVDEQEMVMNLSDMLGIAFFAESALLRLEKLRNKSGVKAETITTQENILKLYLYESTNKVRKLGEDTICSYATGIEKRGLRLALRLLTPHYPVNPKELRRAIADFTIAKGKYPFA